MKSASLFLLALVLCARLSAEPSDSLGLRPFPEEAILQKAIGAKITSVSSIQPYEPPIRSDRFKFTFSGKWELNPYLQGVHVATEAAVVIIADTDEEKRKLPIIHSYLSSLKQTIVNIYIVSGSVDRAGITYIRPADIIAVVPCSCDPTKIVTKQEAIDIARKQLVTARPDLEVMETVPGEMFVPEGPHSGGGPKWVIGFKTKDKKTGRAWRYYVTVCPDGTTDKGRIIEGAGGGLTRMSDPIVGDITKKDAIQLAIATAQKTAPTIVLVSTIDPIVTFGPGRCDKENMWVIKLAALTSTVGSQTEFTGFVREPVAEPRPLPPGNYPKYCRIEVCVKKDGTISSCWALPHEKAE